MKKNPKDMTLDEARNEIFRRIQRGESYREIVKTEYRIDGRIKRFNISEVSKIKQEFTGQASGSKNKDPDMAFLFEEFDKEESLADIVKKTQLSPNFVKQAHDKYIEFRDKRVIPGWIVDELYEFASKIKGEEVTDLEEVLDHLQEAVIRYMKPKFIFPCAKCKKPIELDSYAWKEVYSFLVFERRWGHADCDDYY